MIIQPFELAQQLFQLQGNPFDMSEYPYLRRVFNTKANEVGLFTSRQVGKSTTLAAILVMDAVVAAHSANLFVAPLQGQADVFSLQRLREFIHDSPIVKQGFFTGGKVVDQVYRKVFSNGSMISLGYAQREASRLRGMSLVSGRRNHLSIDGSTPLGAMLMHDEIQSMLPEVFPVIREIGFRAKNPRYWYCGTPLSLNNPMEAFRNRSTSAEWAVRCQATGCKKWNLNWNEKNIGKHGVVCEHCGAPINTNDPSGHWVQRRKMDLENGADARVTMESYRVSQLMVKPIMDTPSGWRDMVIKFRTYSTAQFNNEVLGLPADSSSSPITSDQLYACCKDRPNELPTEHDPRRPPLIMGVDWAFQAENSYTFATIGGWDPFPSLFRLYYWKIFKGVESDSLFQIDWIRDAVARCNIQLVCADWGAGHVQNLQLSNLLGVERVMQVWHTGLRGTAGGRAARCKWVPASGRWHLARTRVLTDTFESLRTKQVEFPRQSECTELFDHILAEKLEYNQQTNMPQYVNLQPDDGLHSLTYAMLGAEMYVNGSFRGHQGSLPSNQSLPPEIDSFGPDALIDSYYGG